MTTAGSSVINAIYTRHSVRAYAPDQVDRDTVRELLEAAVQAPTAIHEEPWAFLVIQDKALLRHVSDSAKPFFAEAAHHAGAEGNAHRLDFMTGPDFNIFYDAGTLIAICGRHDGPFVAADCWLAAENLMLAACEMGLGTCVIGSAVAGMNSAGLKAELGIPAEMTVHAPIIVGVPAQPAQASPRKPPLILSWR